MYSLHLYKTNVQTFLYFQIPFDLENPSEYSWRSSYNLTVQGKGDEVNFESNRLVTRQDKSMAIFVQTDKGIYKFGQTGRLLTTQMYSFHQYNYSHSKILKYIFFCIQYILIT